MLYKKVTIALSFLSILAIFIVLLMFKNKPYSIHNLPDQNLIQQNLHKTSPTSSETLNNTFNDPLQDLKLIASLKIDKTSDLRALGYSGQRKVATNSHGDVFIAYRKKYGSKFQIFVAKISKKDNAWKIEGNTKPIAEIKDIDQRVPSIAIDPHDVVHLVWYGADNKKTPNQRQVKYSKSNDGINWTKWINISEVTGFTNKQTYWQEHPVIFTDDTNSLYVVWEGKDKENQEKQQIKFAHSPDNGKTWSQWKNVQPTPDKTQSRPAILKDSKGKLHLFMYSSFGVDANLQQIQYATSLDNGATWSDWENISNIEDDSRHFNVSLDQNDNLYLVWREGAENKKTQIYFRKLENENWSEIKLVNSNSQYQFFPCISVLEEENGIISFMETSFPSEFPRENPSFGKIKLVSFDKNLIFTDNLPIFKEINENLNSRAKGYPNSPSKIGDQQVIPIIFAEEDEQGLEFAIILQIYQF